MLMVSGCTSKATYEPLLMCYFFRNFALSVSMKSLRASETGSKEAITEACDFARLLDKVSMKRSRQVWRLAQKVIITSRNSSCCVNSFKR